MKDRNKKDEQLFCEHTDTGLRIGEIERSGDEALQESDDHFRTIFDSVNDAIFIHDFETGAVVDVNRQMCEMYGFTREEALRMTATDGVRSTSLYGAGRAELDPQNDDRRAAAFRMARKT